MLDGVDLALFQGAPGQWHGEAGAITWAAVKLTELEPGGVRYVDADAPADWAYLKANDKGRVAYLFGHPSVPAAETVEFFAAELVKLGVEDGDAIALDLEVTDGLAAPAVAKWAADVLAALEKRFDRKPLLYTFLSFIEDGNCAGLGEYPLWISDPSSPKGHPRVADPWKTWAIHQHSISEPIDRDVAGYATRADMVKALGKPPAAPKPDPDPKPKPGTPGEQLISVADLSSPQHIQPGGKITLVWTRAARAVSLLETSPSALVKADVTATVKSSVRLHYAHPHSTRVSIVRVRPDATAPLAHDHQGQAGWDEFDAAVDFEKGAQYRVTVANRGVNPVTVTGGTWHISK